MSIQSNLEIVDDTGKVIVILDKKGIQLFTPVQGGYPGGVLSIDGISMVNEGNLALTGAVTSIGLVTNLGSFTSAQLATALTDETGTGASVFAAGAALTGLTSLGVRDTTAAFDMIIAATSSVTMTADRTLTLGMGDVAHTVLFGTTANTITFPNAVSGTVPFLNLAQTWTAIQTMDTIQMTSNKFIFPATVNNSLNLLPNITTGAIAGVILGTASAVATGTSGAQRGVECLTGFAPTSGTATFSQLNLAPTINQTGGANGITRALYVNPTITAAADLRGIEIANVGTGQTALQTGNGKIGFFATAAAAQQASGANLTNSVTVGGTTDTIADFTSLTVYSTDAAAIRNDIYQLARKLKQVNDALRLYGLLT